ncbi:hypothetical protein BDN70DRAFT_893117 [Pholiota conissans]|uniref:Uncharacterized protein n=1 Tax=Pholiota conissans TaxID=109636 RepID=A0A9P5Z6A8_9AGAR|nr:hypothetical protein BDN70DRAFT_893117 [Pholiota conissans]
MSTYNNPEDDFSSLSGPPVVDVDTSRSLARAQFHDDHVTYRKGEDAAKSSEGQGLEGGIMRRAWRRTGDSMRGALEELRRHDAPEFPEFSQAFEQSIRDEDLIG